MSRKEIEIARRLLESNGYEVSKIHEGMTRDEVDDAIQSGKPFDLESFRRAHGPDTAEMKAHGAIQASDIKVGDTIQIDFDASEVDIGDIYTVEKIRTNDGANWYDVAFECIEGDGSKAPVSEWQGRTTLHYDFDDFVGFKVDTKDLPDMRKSRAQYDLKSYESNSMDEIPHTESYKGYTIQSYDDYGATVYKNGKKIQEFANIDDAREYIDGLDESKNTLQKSIIKALDKLHESTEGLDYDKMKYWNPIAIGSKVANYLGVNATEEEIESEIEKILDRGDRKFQRAVDKALREIEMEKDMTSQDPMHGHKYIVSGATPNVTETGTDYDVHEGGYFEDPEKAILSWLKLSKDHPTMISIDTNKNAYAQELLQWVVDHEDEFRSLCEKYRCPYKTDYMINGCKKKLENPSNFERSKYHYPDQIWPFALG